MANNRRSMLQSQPSRRVFDLMEDVEGVEKSGFHVNNAHKNTHAKPMLMHNAYGARGAGLTRRDTVRNLTAKNESKRRKIQAKEKRKSSGGGDKLSLTAKDVRILEALDEEGSLHSNVLEKNSLHNRIQQWKENSQSFDASSNNNITMMHDESVKSHYSRASSYSYDGSKISSMSNLKNKLKAPVKGLANQVAKRFTKKKNQVPKVIEGRVDGRDVFEGYQDKLKQSNSILRWNWLWLIWCFICPYPLWLTFVDCSLAYEITIIVNLIMVVNFVYTTILCWRYMWKMIRSFNTPFWQELDPELRERVQHVVVLPTYKEPVEILIETISSIANQTIASRLIVVVGMEEKTPLQEEKRRILSEQFGDSFLALVYSVHPYGVPGEIQGACSNRNYAARYAVKYMLQEGLLPIDPDTLEVDLDFTTVTVCDADTTFFYRYFENLTWCFLKESPKSRYEVCWQSPLFYNIALDKRWFFTRVMGILRSYFMVGFLIGWDINTMSIYSQSLKLLIDSRYFHPGYQMDDIIYTLSAMKSTGKRIRIHTIDIPTLSGPTSGETLADEFREWAVQAARWTIGAAEVFHYFTVKMLKGYYLLPGLSYFCWFVYYYIFILSGSVLINLSNFIIQMIGIGVKDISIEECKPFVGWLGEGFNYTWVFPFFTIYTYVTVGGTAFFMDALVSQILALDEDIHPLRNFVHWLMILPVWWMYGIVKFKSIAKIAIQGKDACGHVASEKHALAGVKANEYKEDDKAGSENKALVSKMEKPREPEIKDEEPNLDSKSEPSRPSVSSKRRNLLFDIGSDSSSSSSSQTEDTFAQGSKSNIMCTLEEESDSKNNDALESKNSSVSESDPTSDVSLLLSHSQPGKSRLPQLPDLESGFTKPIDGAIDRAVNQESWQDEKMDDDDDDDDPDEDCHRGTSVPAFLSTLLRELASERLPKTEEFYFT